MKDTKCNDINDTHEILLLSVLRIVVNIGRDSLSGQCTVQQQCHVQISTVAYSDLKMYCTPIEGCVTQHFFSM